MHTLRISSGLPSLVDELKHSYTGPVYIFDLRRIKRRLDHLSTAARSNSVKVLMAAKSFPHDVVYECCSRYLHGFDVSNEKELHAVLPHSASREVSLVGPNISSLFNHSSARTDNHISMINVSSVNQFHEAVSTGVATIGVRMSTTADDGTVSRFGIMPHQLQELPRKEMINGFHFHRGVNYNTVEYFVETAKYLIGIADEMGIDLKYINCGGAQEGLDIAMLFSKLRSVVPDCIDLYVEPGDALFDGCGFLLCRIIDWTEAVCGPRQFVLDSSRECHMKWSQPCYVSLNPGAHQNTSLIAAYGATCYESDYIGTFAIPLSAQAPNADPFVLIGGVTGYAYAWNHTFNGIESAEVVFYE